MTTPATALGRALPSTRGPWSAVMCRPSHETRSGTRGVGPLPDARAAPPTHPVAWRRVNARNRADSLRWAVRLSVASVMWNAVAGLPATVAGVLAGSLALLGFGLDSVVDGAASCMLIWRFQSEDRNPARAAEVEHRAARLVGVALLLIGLYVGARARTALAPPPPPAPRPGWVGTTSAPPPGAAPPPLSHAKRRAADHLGSRALHGDS